MFVYGIMFLMLLLVIASISPELNDAIFGRFQVNEETGRLEGDNRTAHSLVCLAIWQSSPLMGVGGNNMIAIADRMGEFVGANPFVFLAMDGIIGQIAYVFGDGLVVGMFLIVLETFGAHVAGYVVYGRLHGSRILLLAEPFEYAADIFAVVLVGDVGLRIGHLVWLDHQILSRRLRIGAVHIQLEIGHYKEVVPQFVGKIGRVPQQRIEIAHDGDYRFGLPCTLGTVFNLLQRVHHLLYVAAVFGQIEFTPCVVVVFAHISVLFPNRAMRVPIRQKGRFMHLTGFLGIVSVPILSRKGYPVTT